MVRECFIENIHGMTSLKGNGNFRSQHFPAGPVYHSRLIDKTLGHRNICRIQSPHLVRLVDVHAAQQIRVDGVAGMLLVFSFW